MPRLILFLLAAVVILSVYALVDCAMAAKERVRGVAKPAWIIIIALLPLIGALLWLFVGRPRKGRGPVQRLAPDDDPAFIGTLSRNSEQDERIRQIERELALLDSNGDAPESGAAAAKTVDASDVADTKAEKKADTKADKKSETKAETTDKVDQVEKTEPEGDSDRA